MRYVVPYRQVVSDRSARWNFGRRPPCPPYVLTTTQPPPNKNNGLNTKVNGVHMSLTLAPGACGHVGVLYNYVRPPERGRPG